MGRMQMRVAQQFRVKSMLCCADSRQEFAQQDKCSKNDVINRSSRRSMNNAQCSRCEECKEAGVKAGCSMKRVAVAAWTRSDAIAKVHFAFSLCSASACLVARRATFQPRSVAHPSLLVRLCIAIRLISFSITRAALLTEFEPL